MSDMERLDRWEAEGLAMHTDDYERQITQTMNRLIERTRRDAALADRRERIATALLAGLLANPSLVGPIHEGRPVALGDLLDWDLSQVAVEQADHLLVDLRNREHGDGQMTLYRLHDLLRSQQAAEARDREATK